MVVVSSYELGCSTPQHRPSRQITRVTQVGKKQKGRLRE